MLILNDIPVIRSHALALVCFSGVGFTVEQRDSWCPGWPDMKNPKNNGNGISTTTPTPTTTTNNNSGEDSTPTTTTSSSSSSTSAYVVELNGCCFVLSVADAHNMDVGDRSAPFCITGSSAEGAGGDGGGGSMVRSTVDGGGTMEVIKFPLGRWEIGTVQEVRFRRESPVAHRRGPSKGFYSYHMLSGRNDGRGRVVFGSLVYHNANTCPPACVDRYG